jgi:glutamyl-tRNA synthetase
VIRFRNPDDGTVAWDDGVKGRIEFANAELDDLVIARSRRHADVQLLRRRRRLGHADHARDPRRRPRQQHAAPDQHLPRARLDAPRYAHVPMCSARTAKLSKRHGAVSVMEYEAAATCPRRW